MKYLIGILSVLGLITIGTTLFPVIEDGVKFAQAKLQGEAENALLPIEQSDDGIFSDVSQEMVNDPRNAVHNFTGCIVSLDKFYPGDQTVGRQFIRMADEYRNRVEISYLEGSEYIDVGYYNKVRAGTPPMNGPLKHLYLGRGSGENLARKWDQFFEQARSAASNGWGVVVQAPRTTAHDNINTIKFGFHMNTSTKC